MFFFGFLSSTSPYVIMLLAYLIFFFTGTLSPRDEAKDKFIVAEAGHTTGIENEDAFCQSYSVDYSVVAVVCNDSSLDVFFVDIPVSQCSGIPHLIVEKEFSRFFFSLPPPFFC